MPLKLWENFKGSSVVYVLTKFLTLFLVAGSQCNTANLTFDGVDLMGERLADEVFG